MCQFEDYLAQAIVAGMDGYFNALVYGNASHPEKAGIYAAIANILSTGLLLYQECQSENTDLTSKRIVLYSATSTISMLTAYQLSHLFLNKTAPLTLQEIAWIEALFIINHSFELT